MKLLPSSVSQITAQTHAVLAILHWKRGLKRSQNQLHVSGEKTASRGKHADWGSGIVYVCKVGGWMTRGSEEQACREIIHVLMSQKKE